MSEIESLFQPMTIRGRPVPNRIVMTPMTRSFSSDGILGEDVAVYYQRPGDADVSLLIAEGSTIALGGASNDEKATNFRAERTLKGWSCVAETTHKTLAKIGLQLWHVDMMRQPGTGPFRSQFRQPIRPHPHRHPSAT